MRLFLFFFILLFISCKQQNEDVPDQTPEPFEGFVIAFGSCNDQQNAQPLWQDIAAEHPDLWIWLGDNIYGDTEDMTLLAGKYESQNLHPDYSAFKSNVPIIGVWDDHDYGVNDGDKTFAQKIASQQLALDFLDVPADAPVRTQEGIYQSHVFDYNDLRIRVLLLDGRYFRDFLVKDQSAYVPDADADILGQAQWAWLEGELAKNEDVLIIGCGIQFIPEEHRFEKWANFPTSRNRLFELLDQDSTEKIILISGDRHIGEMSKIKLGTKDIHEVTSSGLTHSWTSIGSEPNQHRIGQLTPNLNYGLIRIAKNSKIELILSGENQKRHMTVTL